MNRTHTPKIGFIVLGALVASATLAANGATPPTATQGPSFGPMLIALLLVIALIPAALWLLKRIGPEQHASIVGLKIITQLTLGPRERIVVLESGDHWLLLGVTSASIQRIGTLPKGELPQLHTPSFKSVLQRIKHPS